MRVAADANVLLRVLLRDDVVQTAQAEALLDRADPLVLFLIVLCEVVWVLERRHRFGSEAIHEVLKGLTAPSNVEVDRAVVNAGLQMLQSGGGFSDGCILEQAKLARCRALATFDQALLKHGRPVAAHPTQLV